ncbi:MAG: 30S ribosomal protein S2, partial [Candidatus Omnitrophica bacterium]|nr:30S ribosomal protein S2 [Candidatus Omnitrophota bacterium]
VQRTAGSSAKKIQPAPRAKASDIRKEFVDSENLIAPTALFLSSGVHMGMKFKTKMMGKYIYKTRNDGLNVIDVQAISDRIKLAGKMLADYEPKDILVVSRRENTDKIVEKFGELTGIIVKPKRYLPGTMTNPQYDEHYEPKILVASDPWQDRNALHDSLKIGIPVIALCGTSNTTNNVDLVIPCNNRSPKGIGFVFWLLAREYLRNRGLLEKDKELPVSFEEFIGEPSEAKSKSEQEGNPEEELKTEEE